MKRIFFILLLAGFTGSLVKAQALKGSSWQLKSIDEIETGKSQTIQENVKVSLVFDSDSTYSGNACNHYTGHYSTMNSKNLTMQKASSPPVASCLGVGPLEKQVLDLYLKATRYRMDGEKLFVFTSDDHRLIFLKK